MKKTTRILLISAAILAIGLIACSCTRSRKEDEIDFSPIENQQSSSAEINSSDSSESSSSSEENSSVPTESTSSSSEESSVPDNTPVSSSSSKPASSSSNRPVYTERPVGSTSEESSSASSAPAPGYNIIGIKSEGKWVEMPGGKFWKEGYEYYYSYEDWVYGKESVPKSIVKGENIEDYDGPIIEWN